VVKAEIGGMFLQAREQKGLLTITRKKLGRDKETSSPDHSAKEGSC
jgi:hypothetical protein